MSPNMVSYGALKRNKDGSFILSPEQLKTILETEDVEDLPIELRPAYKTIPPLPKRLERVPFGGSLYLIPKRLKNFYLRLQAIRKFASESLDAFSDTAGSGLYGAVDQGDWEKAEITSDQSGRVVLSNKLLAPLEKEWERIQNEWTKRGIDVEEADYVIDEYEDTYEYKERFDEKYAEYIQQSSEDLSERAALEKVLDAFVDSMMDIES